mgnify:CR=1 FL=1
MRTPRVVCGVRDLAAQLVGADAVCGGVRRRIALDLGVFLAQRLEMRLRALDGLARGGDAVVAVLARLLERCRCIVEAALEPRTRFACRGLLRLGCLKRRFEPSLRLGVGVLHLLELLFQGIDALLDLGLLLLRGALGFVCRNEQRLLLGDDLGVARRDILPVRELVLLF